MRIFELILQNVRPEKIAEDAVKIVSETAGDITHTTLDFLHSISDAIQFTYYVTAEECTEMKFNWPQELAIVFRYEHERSTFELYTKYLEQFYDMMRQEGYHEQLEKIMELFIKFATSMDPEWAVNFSAPISLIGFHLLKKNHERRKDGPSEPEVLNNICQQLFEVTRMGLGPEVSHNTITKGLCCLLEEDYDYFWKMDKNIFQFFIDCLDYEIAGSGGNTFSYMKNALESKQITGEPRDAFVKFLIDPELVEPWCGLCRHQSKNLVRSLLKFLNTLLRYLPILECFTRRQVHFVFKCALKTNASIRTLAVQFYIGFMKRNFKEKFIFRDILDFYLNQHDGLENLDNFIASLWNEFPYISYFELYMRVLKKSDWNLNILCVTAQFTFRVYRELYKECETNDEYATRLSKLLLGLPEILTGLQEKWEVKGILTQVYSITQPQTALVTIKDFPIAADGFIKYALNYLNNNVEDHKITQSTAINMIELMAFFNNEEEMELFSSTVYTKYKHLMTNPSELTESQAKDLEHVLAILSAITDEVTAMNGESILELASDLTSRLTESNIFEDLSIQHNCSIDAFAVGACSGCLNSLSIMIAQLPGDDTSVEVKLLLEKVDPFFHHVINRIGDDDLPKVTLLFAEIAVQALCDIFRIFNVELKREIYHVLVNCVNKYVFETKSPDQDLYDLQSQRSILMCFNFLHKFIEIPAPITWKILVHFGLRSEFEAELTKLLDIVLLYKTENFEEYDLFMNVVPIAIFNLYKRKVKPREMQKSLRAYRRFIEKNLSDVDQRLMKLHIITSIIDIIAKSIEAGDITQESNRVELLNSMEVLMPHTQPHEAKVLLEHSKRLLSHDLSTAEHETIRNFQKQVSQ